MDGNMEGIVQCYEAGKELLDVRDMSRGSAPNRDNDRLVMTQVDRALIRYFYRRWSVRRMTGTAGQS